MRATMTAGLLGPLLLGRRPAIYVDSFTTRRGSASSR